MKIKYIIRFILLAILISLIGFLIYSNVGIDYNYYSLYDNDFGIKICHISDYHNKKLDSKLVDKIKSENVDFIAITGDLIDSGKGGNALEFITNIKDIAPIYYVTGNHEADDMNFLPSFLLELEILGVNILQNKSVYFTKNNKNIKIIGVDDPLISDSALFLNSLETDDEFKVLLTHRPERIDQYVNCNTDLVLSGHTHGGLFKLPFVGGLYDPNQGFFPKYYEGIYNEQNTTMVVSKGVGNSVIPFRFLNKAEVIFISI